MKNFALAFSVLLLILSSCSKNDTSTTQDPILLKKMIQTDSKTGTSSTIDITYTGNKKVTEIGTGSNAYKNVYTYTGDLITKIENNNTTTNSVTKTTDYSYTNGVLSTSINSTPAGTSKSKILYIHNSDGTISFQKSTINLATNVEIFGETGKYTYANSNLIKSELININTITKSYEYDNKNNTSKNILGISLLLELEVLASSNNWTKSTDVYGTVTPVYTYNSSNYPTQQVIGTTTTQYFY
jgi:hypothetical protein